MRNGRHDITGLHMTLNLDRASPCHITMWHVMLSLHRADQHYISSRVVGLVLQIPHHIERIQRWTCFCNPKLPSHTVKRHQVRPSGARLKSHHGYDVTFDCNGHPLQGNLQRHIASMQRRWQFRRFRSMSLDSLWCDIGLAENVRRWIHRMGTQTSKNCPTSH